MIAEDPNSPDKISGVGVFGEARLLRMTGMIKSFGGQRVLHGVDFDLRAGEVHILAGENGAGKSTLIKLLGGVHEADSGEIRIDGHERRFKSPREATLGGVAIIHQELSLVLEMSVADNIFLGREWSRLGFVRRSEQDHAAADAIARLGLHIDVRRAAGSFPIAVQQMIEIAKALSCDARILVMDEPTSALNDPEVQRLFDAIAGLKARGCGVIYITHKLDEVYRIGDRITVLRDGRRIAQAPADEMPADLLVRHMVGRELPAMDEPRAGKARADTPVVLSVSHLSARAASGERGPLVSDVSFNVHAGEIVGLGGLQGSGASELLWALFGAQGRGIAGEVRIDGLPYRPLSPRHAIRRGLALVTNDRQRTGLVPGLSVAANATLAALPRVSPGGWMSTRRESDLAAQSSAALHLRAASLDQPVATLSGGNQQKIVLAKWLNTQPRVLLLDEPTRGVDVGAKHEIYALMNEWRAAGRAILLITSEMPELLLMSDRILVLHRGKLTASFDRSEATQERILHAAMGGEDVAA